MAESVEFYLARAEACASEARAASLDNVRERALRAEHAWREMAARQIAVRAQREASDAERAARIAQELEAGAAALIAD